MLFTPASAGLQKTLDRVQSWQDNKGELTGLATGLTAWDDATGGFEATDLVILGGRPGMGKSALALNVAARVARKCGDGEAVLVVSTEMPADLVRRRLASMRSGISDHKLRLGAGTADEYERFRQSLVAVGEMPLLISDRPAVWVDNANVLDGNTVAGSVRVLLRDGQTPKLLIVDHLSRMGDDPSQSPNVRIEGIARKLKNLALETGVPVLALSQLNRQVEQRDDKRPALSDLRDSGSIEAEADMVILLYRQDYYLSPDQTGYDRRLAGKCLCDIAKARSGPTGVFTLTFDGSTQLFS